MTELAPAPVGADAQKRARTTVLEEILRRQQAEDIARRRRDRVLKIGAPLVTAAVIGLLWQRWAVNADSLMVPTAGETVSAMFRLVTEGAFWSALAISSKSAGLGFLFAVLSGVPIGVLMARTPRFERVMDVYVSLVLTTPIAAIMPLLLMITGIGTTTLVIVVLLFAWPFIVVNTKAGVAGVDPGVIEMARSFGASEATIWRKILLPAASPEIFVGLRLGLSRAINGVFVAELILIAVGLGGLLLENRARFQGAELYGTVGLVLLISLALLALLRRLQLVLFPWTEGAAR